MNCQPKISVIIPCYNSALFISEAISSVLSQRYSNIELIIVDDGSDDNTKERVDHLNVTYHYYAIPHSGAAFARNLGVEKSTGEYLAFLDADDLWPENKLLTQLQALRSGHLDAVFTMIEQFVDSSCENIKLKKMEITEGICTSAMLITRKKFLEVGYFKSEFVLGEFIEWFIRAKKMNLRFDVVRELVTRRRIHKNNTSQKYKSSQKDYLIALFDGLKNQRTHNEEILS